MDRYPIETLPFPVKPKDTVYFVVDSDEGPVIESDHVDAVGVNDERRLIVYCSDGYDYEVSLENRCFLTHEDAKCYIEDSATFTDDYGTTDLWPDDMPFYPGVDVYTYEDYPPEIFGTLCYEVLFTEDGEVTVIDDMSCWNRVVGDEVDPCFLTYEEAHAYMYEHLQELLHSR